MSNQQTISSTLDFSECNCLLDILQNKPKTKNIETTTYWLELYRNTTKENFKDENKKESKKK